MSMKFETGSGICPLTLESYERCCEKKILSHQELCSFTLERCHFNITGNFHYANLEMKTPRHTNQERFNPLQESRIPAAHR